MSKTYEQMEKDYQKQKDQFISRGNEINSLNNQIVNLNEMNESRGEQIRNMEFEIETMKIKTEDLEKNLDNQKTNEIFLTEKEEKFYDVIIVIDSINKLIGEGWEIKYNEENKKIYDKIIGEETIKIGVLGLNNVGKSFLLGLISGEIIPTGYSIETKGVSIKYKTSDHICLLDSAGFETPLLKSELNSNTESGNKEANIPNNLRKRKEEFEIAKDKTQTERFIEQLIISLSDMLILVIGKLTRTEQKLITRIKNIVENKETIKKIIIIHNLAQYHRIIEVKNHIKNILLQSATFTLLKKNVIGIEEYKNRFYYVEEKDSTNIEVYHYIMAKQGTEAGNYYNDLTVKLIQQNYNNCNERKKIDIPEEIVKLFSSLSHEILEDFHSKELEISSDKKKIKIKEGNLNNQENKEIFKINQSYIDEIGDYKSPNIKSKLKYSLYFYKEQEKNKKKRTKFQNYLLLVLEIAGKLEKLKAKYYKKEKIKGILIEGRKAKEDFSKEYQEIENNRIFEDFQYFIELKNNIEIIENESEETTTFHKFFFDTRNWEVEEEENDKEYKKEIDSGIYSIKFKLSESSSANLLNKYE